MTKLFQDKIALVTGATRGIGRATAVALAKQGAHVIAIGRTQSALERLDDEIKELGGSATLIAVDLKNRDAIGNLGDALLQRFGKLDIFIANAGVLGELAPVNSLDHKIWDEVMEVNLTANWQLTAQLDPLLKLSDHGRVVYITTGTTTSFRPFWGAYTVSKAGLEALAKTYAAEVENTNIGVSIINPGATRSDMRAKAMPGEDPASIKSADDLAPMILEMCQEDVKNNGTRINYDDWAAK